MALHPDGKLQLECFSTDWDTITVETDDTGLLKSFFSDEFIVTPNGEAIVSGSLEQGVTNIADEIAAASLDSYKNQQVLLTRDPFQNDPGLLITPASYEFSITDERPFGNEPAVSSVDDVDSFFSDKRLSSVPNFMFLPPIQSSPDSEDGLPLGKYEQLSENNDLDSFDPLTTLEDLEGVSMSFSNKTEEHTLALQIFEERDGKVRKLDVIRYGPVGVSPEGGQSVLYFVGKVFVDGFEVPTFVNLFTMVLE